MSEGRHASKSSRAKPAVIVGIVAVVAVIAVVLILVISGGKNGPHTGKSSSAGSKPVPAFTFTLGRVQAVPTRSGVLPKKLINKAATASKSAATILDSYYTDAFLDPNVWGKTPTAFANFTTDAKAGAAKKLTIITAGPNAATELKDLQPAASKLTTQVLFDDKGNAYQVMATVMFQADATLQAGGHATLVSTGQFFLTKVGSSWKVVAFELKRADRSGAPSPVPSAAPSGPTQGLSVSPSATGGQS